MRGRRILLGAVALGLAAPGVAQADRRSEAIAGAQRAIASHSSAVHDGAGQTFAARTVSVDRNGVEHVRMDRRYRGLAVLGGDVVIHRDGAGAWRGVSLSLRAPLALSTAPRVSAGDAAATAVRAGQSLQGRPALVVDARSAQPRLAWQVTATGTQADGTPSEQRVTVDALTGRVLVREETVETATGSGNGYYSGTVPLETTLASGSYQLKDPTRGGTYTTDMGNRTKGNGSLFTDADNLWGSGTTADRASIGVDAQYGTNETWDFYRDTFGRTGIRGDGRGSFNRAHYGNRYNNAFWQDSCFCMTYGDGDGRTYKPFVALDVAGHEMSHGVTASTAALTYAGESGGLNEATSDIFGTLVEFYAHNAKDPADYLIGERLRFDGKPLRYMDDPRKDGGSASCWSSGVGSLNVHYSSGVANHFFYLLAVGSGQSAYGDSPTCDGSTVAGIGNADAGRIWYRALTTYMTSSTNYKAARTATLQAASDLFGAASAQRAAVDRAWAAVSVTA